MSNKAKSYAVVLLGLLASGALIGGLVMLVTGMPMAMGLVVMSAGSVGFGAALLLSGRYPLKPNTSRDHQQVLWANSMFAFSVMSLVFSPLAGGSLWGSASGADEVARWPLAIFALFSMAAIVQLELVFRRNAVIDELMRHYAANAMRWGFGAAIAGLVALVALAQMVLQYAITGIPVVLGLMLFATGVRLWWQVREAESG